MLLDEKSRYFIESNVSFLTNAMSTFSLLANTLYLMMTSKYNTWIVCRHSGTYTNQSLDAENDHGTLPNR